MIAIVTRQCAARPKGTCFGDDSTPGLHNKIPAHKIFARGWVAQKLFCSQVVAKTFQGLGPKRRESCNGDRLCAARVRRGPASEMIVVILIVIIVVIIIIMMIMIIIVLVIIIMIIIVIVITIIMIMIIIIIIIIIMIVMMITIMIMMITIMAMMLLL